MCSFYVRKLRAQLFCAYVFMLMKLSPGVNYFNPQMEGANAMAHRVGHKRCCFISSIELQPTLELKAKSNNYTICSMSVVSNTRPAPPYVARDHLKNWQNYKFLTNLACFQSFSSYGRSAEHFHFSLEFVPPIKLSLTPLLYVVLWQEQRKSSCAKKASRMLMKFTKGEE
jgi:hypothetical protein